MEVSEILEPRFRENVKCHLPGEAMGSLNWFAVHPTSMNSHLIRKQEKPGIGERTEIH